MSNPETRLDPFQDFAARLRETHPDLVGPVQDRSRRTARKKWHPILLRVYGIRPWEMGGFSLREYSMLVDDLEKNGIGGL